MWFQNKKGGNKMTCIVGIVDEKSGMVVIGGDSASSNEYKVLIRKDEKVFKNGKFLFGCSSSYRMIQLLRYSFTPPLIGELDIDTYMRTRFINEVRACFKKGGYLQSEKRGDELGGFFLVGYEDRLFKIEDDFQVGENLFKYDAIGSGQDFALGALHALSTRSAPARLKISRALEAAQCFALGVEAPFVILTT